jgi:hypothetical protein
LGENKIKTKEEIEMSTATTVVKSELIVRASKKLADEIRCEIKIPDPDKMRAMAILGGEEDENSEEEEQE